MLHFRGVITRLYRMSESHQSATFGKASSSRSSSSTTQLRSRGSSSSSSYTVCTWGFSCWKKIIEIDYQTSVECVVNKMSLRAFGWIWKVSFKEFQQAKSLKLWSLEATMETWWNFLPQKKNGAPTFPRPAPEARVHCEVAATHPSRVLGTNQPCCEATMIWWHRHT